MGTETDDKKHTSIWIEKTVRDELRELGDLNNTTSYNELIKILLRDIKTLQKLDLTLSDLLTNFEKLNNLLLKKSNEQIFESKNLASIESRMENLEAKVDQQKLALEKVTSMIELVMSELTAE